MLWPLLDKLFWVGARLILMQTMSLSHCLTNWHWKPQQIEYSEWNWNSLWSDDMHYWNLYDITKIRHYQFNKRLLFYEQITSGVNAHITLKIKLDMH